jgi:hypothetical protein
VREHQGDRGGRRRSWRKNVHRLRHATAPRARVRRTTQRAEIVGRRDAAPVGGSVGQLSGVDPDSRPEDSLPGRRRDRN